MKCPRCSNQLIILELNEIEIDYCTKCEGIWLDSGELELLLEDSDKKNEFLKSFETTESSKENKIKCPICSKKMNKVLVKGVKDEIIDECKNLCGIWFDKGELLRIIKSSGEEENKKVINLLEEMFEYKLNNPEEK